MGSWCAHPSCMRRGTVWWPSLPPLSTVPLGTDAQSLGIWPGSLSVGPGNPDLKAVASLHVAALPGPPSSL